MSDFEILIALLALVFSFFFIFVAASKSGKHCYGWLLLSFALSFVTKIFAEIGSGAWWASCVPMMASCFAIVAVYQHEKMDKSNKK